MNRRWAQMNADFQSLEIVGREISNHWKLRAGGFVSTYLL
jgi:hypothetical protein